MLLVVQVEGSVVASGTLITAIGTGTGTGEIEVTETVSSQCVVGTIRPVVVEVVAGLQQEEEGVEVVLVVLSAIVGQMTPSMEEEVEAEIGSISFTVKLSYYPSGGRSICKNR
jgi:hypothetical protein